MNRKNMTIKLLIAIFVFLPLIVKANDYCTVVSGDGKSIGSEIACGEEHFYIIDSDDNNVRMLTKYNLYAGQNYTVLTFTEERWNELMAKYGSNLTYLLSEPEFDGYDEFHTFDHVNHSIVVSRNLEYDYKIIVLSEERWNEVASQYDIHYYSNPYTNNQSLYYDHKPSLLVRRAVTFWSRKVPADLTRTRVQFRLFVQTGVPLRYCLITKLISLSLGQINQCSQRYIKIAMFITIL